MDNPFCGTWPSLAEVGNLQRGRYVPPWPPWRLPVRLEPADDLVLIAEAVRHRRNGRSASAEISVRRRPKSLFGSLRNHRSVSPVTHKQGVGPEQARVPASDGQVLRVLPSGADLQLPEL